jgi:shikimate 5-dehydrogenase
MGFSAIYFLEEQQYLLIIGQISSSFAIESIEATRPWEYDFNFTFSPQLHNTLSRYLGVDATYVPFHVGKGQLEYSIKGLLAVNVLGFNITIPYKKDVINYIDDISREAALIGAVNTVKNINGRLYGYNTDAAGFIRSFKEETGMGLNGKKVVLLGAGGAARAIAVGLAFEEVSEISIINRTISKAAEIAGIINNNISYQLMLLFIKCLLLFIFYPNILIETKEPSSSLLKNCLPVFKRVQKSLSHASYFLIPIWLQHIVQLCSFLPQIRLSDLYISVLLQI